MSLVDMYEDYAVFRAYYPTGTNKLLRINYSVDNGEIVLGDVSEVRVVYEPIEEQSDEPSGEAFSDTTPEASENVESEAPSITVDNADGADLASSSLTLSNEPGIVEGAEQGESASEAESSSSDFSTETTNGNSDTTDNFTEGKEPTSNAEETENDGTQEENFNTTQSEDSSSSATFTDGERAEFEALKREKKINIINSYRAYLSEEEYNNFINSVDSYADNDKLEFDLLKIFRAFTEAHAHESKSQTTVPFSFNGTTTNEAQDSVQNYMKRLLKR